MLSDVPAQYGRKLEQQLRKVLFETPVNKVKTSRTIWLLLAASVIYFAVLQLILRHYESGLSRDSVGILEHVANWHKTGVYADWNTLGSFVPPLALYCFRLPLALNWPLEQGILLLNLLLGMTVPVLFFLLIREAGFSSRIALVSGWLLASNPYLHDVYNAILRDTVFIPLVLLTVCLMLRNFRKPDFRTAGIAGVFAALAFLTRYEGIVLPAVFAAGIVAAARRDGSWKKALPPMLGFCLFWTATNCLILQFWGILPIALKIYLWRFQHY